MLPPRPHLLIVGAGSIGERHLRCALATGRGRVSFAEVQADLREQVAARYSGAQAFASLESALAAGPVDAAVIATPAPLHVPQATHLVERGIHVLIEKPLSVTLEGVEELLALAAERRVVAAVAYVYRAHPALGAMREAIASKRFGAPVELIAVCGQNFAHYRPAYRQTYYARHESGGGAVQDALTHVINAGEWLVGPVDRVVADAARQVLEGTEVEDTVHVLARHGRVLASYALNQHQAPNELTITVVCERGTTRFEYHANAWRYVERPDGDWSHHQGAPLERDALFARQTNAFLDAIRGGPPPACSLQQGAQTLRVNLAALESVRTQAWVTVNAR